MIVFHFEISEKTNNNIVFDDFEMRNLILKKEDSSSNLYDSLTFSFKTRHHSAVLFFPTHTKLVQPRKVRTKGKNIVAVAATGRNIPNTFVASSAIAENPKANGMIPCGIIA